MSSSSSSGGVEILLTVIKEFSNEDRKCLEITLVRHSEYDCLELLGFDSATNSETNRLYISLKKVRSKLSRKTVDEETSKIESESIAPKTQQEKLTKAMTDLTLEFLLCRLRYKPNELNPEFVLFMTNAVDSAEDVDSSILPAFQYEVRPDGVVPFRLVRASQQSDRLGSLETFPGSPAMRGSPGHPRKASTPKVISVHQHSSSSPSSSSPVSGPADHSYSSSTGGGFSGGEQLLANDHSNLLRMDVWTSALPPEDHTEGAEDPSSGPSAVPTAAPTRRTGSGSVSKHSATSSAAAGGGGSGGAGKEKKFSSLRRRSFEAAAQLAQRVLPQQLVPLVLGSRSVDHASGAENNHNSTTTPGKEGSLPQLAPSAEKEQRKAPKRRNTFGGLIPSLSIEPEQLVHLPRTHRLAGTSVKTDAPNTRNRRTLDDDLAAQHSIKQQQPQSQPRPISGMDSARLSEEQQQQQGGGEGVPHSEGTKKQHTKPKKLSYHMVKNYY